MNINNKYKYEKYKRKYLNGGFICEKLEKELEDIKKKLTEKDEQIKEIKKVFDIIMNNLNPSLLKQINLENELKEKDEQLKEKDKQLKEKDDQLKEKDEKLKEIKEIKKEFNIIMNNLNSHLLNKNNVEKYLKEKDEQKY